MGILLLDSEIIEIYYAIGGGIAGGTCEYVLVQSIFGEGGAIGGGDSFFTNIQSFVGVGGALGGGAGSIACHFEFSSADGAIGGGSSPFCVGVAHHPIGGAISGGIIFWYEPSPGVLVSGGSVDVLHTGVFDIEFPAMEVQFDSSVEAGNFTIYFPNSVIEYTGLVGVVGSFNIYIPRSVVQFSGPQEFEIVFPQPVVEFAGYPGIVGQFDIEFSPTVEFYGNQEFDIEIPVPVVEFTGCPGNVGQFALDFGVVESEFTGTVGEIGSFDINFPILEVSFNALQNEIGEFEAILPSLTVDFYGSPGNVGTYDLSLPKLEVEFNSAIAIVGVFDIGFPVPPVEFMGEILPITIIYKGLAMNMTHFAVSEYTSEFGFHGLAYFNGLYFSANSSGIYVLGGETDSGRKINARIKSPPYDFWENFIRRAKDVWLTYRSNGELTLVLELDEDEIWEKNFESLNTKIHEERVKIARGIKSRFYSFEIRNREGSDFSIDKLSVLVEEIQRRRR